MTSKNLLDGKKFLHTLWLTTSEQQIYRPISGCGSLLDERTSQLETRIYRHVHNLFFWCHHNIPELLIFIYSATSYLWASFPFFHNPWLLVMRQMIWVKECLNENPTVTTECGFADINVFIRCQYPRSITTLDFIPLSSTDILCFLLTEYFS